MLFFAELEYATRYIHAIPLITPDPVEYDIRVSFLWNPQNREWKERRRGGLKNKIKGSSQKSKSVETVEEAKEKEKKKRYHCTYISSLYPAKQASKQAA